MPGGRKKKSHHLKKAICYDFDFVKDMYLKNIKKTRWQRLLLPELPNWQEPKPHTLSPGGPGLRHGDGGSGPWGQQGQAQTLGRRPSPAPLRKVLDEVVSVGQRRAWCRCYRLAVWRHSWRSIPVQIVCTSTWWHVLLQNKTHPINVRNEPSEKCPSCWLPVKGGKIMIS